MFKKDHANKKSERFGKESPKDPVTGKGIFGQDLYEVQGDKDWGPEDYTSASKEGPWK